MFESNQLPTHREASCEAALVVASRMLGQPVVHAERVGAGRNGRVFKVEVADGSPYLLKFYYHHPSDPRDRLNTEWGALAFLEQHGVRQVARPLVRDDQERAALYSFIHGDTAFHGAIGERDLQSALSFVRTLWELSKAPDAHALPSASEASFSWQALVDSVASRIQKLEQIQSVILDVRDRFLCLLGEIKSNFTEVRNEIERNHKGTGLSEELPVAERTLSPSDFGFHNGVRCDDGWKFVDFEYFGWDDPGKLIADFCLHPAMQLTASQQDFFIRGALEVFATSESLPRRLPYLLQLYTFKWCTIVLNEFIPEHRARRGFAAQREEDLRVVLETQLTKGESLIYSAKKRLVHGTNLHHSST